MELGFSLEPNAEPIEIDTTTVSDRRSASRHISVMLFAKVIGEEAQLPCRVLNLSLNGAKIETHARLERDSPVLIEFRSDFRVAGTVRWAKIGQAGIQFDAPIDFATALRRSDISIARIKPRPPRYVCSAKVIIDSDRRLLIGRAIDISTSGVKVRCPHSLRSNSEVMVEIEGMPRHRARVVWASSGTAGLKFINQFKYHELEMWLLSQPQPEAQAKPC